MYLLFMVICTMDTSDTIAEVIAPIKLSYSNCHYLYLININNIYLYILLMD